jgi:hypothetical protein
MKHQRHRGVALIITLIMLSVVTVMAVVFLGISRRERFSVGVTASQTDARLAADAGLVRAQSELLARVAASNNLSDFDFFVSTNYVKRSGFVSGRSRSSIENGNYAYADGRPLVLDDLLQNLTNLFLDPRAPVFVRTNRSRRSAALDRYDFRYFLDLNRNGLFETNGWVEVFSQGRLLQDPPAQLPRTNFLWGDPEWIGVLERPDYPHSPSNRFVSRYAYVVMPAGRSLNLNYLHNQSKELRLRGQLTTAAGPLYNRNQGVGAHELNLAAFLRAWLPADPYYPWQQYRYEPESFTMHSGLAFRDATDLFKYRHGLNPQVPRPLNQTWPALEALRLSTNAVDYYAANVYRFAVDSVNEVVNKIPQGSGANDPIAAPFPGGEGLKEFRTVSELYDPAKVGRLNWVLTNSAMKDFFGRNPPQPDTTNRYAFYRLISQLGTDSLPASRGKINLNYVNGTWRSPNIDAAGNWTLASPIEKGEPVIYSGDILSLTNWNETARGRHDFFMLTADAILKKVMPEILPKGLEDGIPVYPTNLYSGAVHRCLQMAVNLLDANEMPAQLLASRSVVSGTNTLFAPTVFRPIYDWETASDGTRVLKILGYQEVINTDPLAAAWIDPMDPVGVNRVQPGYNLYGVPWVIGVEKGWPNFNELYCESSVLVTRRLRASRVSPSSTSVTFQQGYEIGISNTFGLESWNAYTQDLGVAVSLLFTNQVTMGLVDSNRLDISRGGRLGLVQTNLAIVRTNLTTGLWAARDFRVFTNAVTLVPRASYLPGLASPLRTNIIGVVYDPSPGFPVPDWHLEMTNRLLYVATAPIGNEDRIVDLVTLNPLVAGFHIQRFMVGETNYFDSNSLDPGRFWWTNRLVSSLNAMTAGITNQLFVSTNDVAARADWSNWSEDPVSGMQRERAIDEFRMFMGMLPLFDQSRKWTPAVNVQVPFTPTRRLLQRMSWQANDPLVHYSFDDLYSTELANPTNVVSISPTGDPEGYTPGLPNLDEINTRYSPWGGRLNKQLSGQTAAYNPEVQDPGVSQADDYEFSRQTMPSIGWMGRVHRGSPWQTVYLKSGVSPMRVWVDHAGETRVNAFSHPTNDWRILDLFTTALTESMTQGLLSVNQTNEAAWAAVFAGLRVQSNTVSSLNAASGANYARTDISIYRRMYVDPDVERRSSDQFYRLVEGINTNRLLRPSGQYSSLGDILSARVLTDESPYLNLAGMESGQARVNDAVYEWIPRQILGLLREDQPYFTVYSYGQALRPAQSSLVLTPGLYFNLCTNYQVVGEVLTKTGFRIERETAGTNVFYNAVVEDFEILPVD